jgi:hypothetical protein
MMDRPRKLFNQASLLVYLLLSVHPRTWRNNESMTDPDGIKKAMCEYLTGSYKRSEPPDIPKPWMETPSVRKVRERAVAAQ